MDVIRSIGKQSGESVESVAKKKIPRDVVVLGITASSVDLIVPTTRRTTMGAGPRLRRRSTARLEQSTGRDPSQPISSHL